MAKFIKFIASFCCLGHIPIMPGTFGSLGGLAIYYLAGKNPALLALSVILVFILGMISAKKAEELFGQIDDKRIVIDEVCGMLASLLFLPFSITIIILAFVIFRIMDVLKPPPIRSIEGLQAPYGIMFDDLLAAVYTNIILQILVRAIKIKI